MARNHKPEEIIGKLREAEIVLAQGGTVADACRRIGVTEQSYYRWRKEYGGSEDGPGSPDGVVDSRRPTNWRRRTLGCGGRSRTWPWTS